MKENLHTETCCTVVPYNDNKEIPFNSGHRLELEKVKSGQQMTDIMPDEINGINRHILVSC